MLPGKDHMLHAQAHLKRISDDSLADRLPQHTTAPIEPSNSGLQYPGYERTRSRSVRRHPRSALGRRAHNARFPLIRILRAGSVSRDATPRCVETTTAGFALLWRTPVSVCSDVCEILVNGTGCVSLCDSVGEWQNR
jgi:hypothetical protein